MYLYLIEFNYSLQRGEGSTSLTSRDIYLVFFLFIINLPLFSTVVPASIFMFLSCRPFVAITLSTGLVGVEVTFFIVFDGVVIAAQCTATF